MNPVLEEWFEELDDGDEDLRTFIRQVSDLVLTETGAAASFVQYLEERGLAVVPISRLWWENPRSKMFNPARSLLHPPGHVDSLIPGDVDADEVEQIEISDLGAAFLGGALEGIALGQRVSYLTDPSGPMNQQDAGTGVVVVVDNSRIGVVNDNGDDFWVDMSKGGKIRLVR